MKTYNFDRLISYLDSKNIATTENMIRQLTTFYEMLIEKNKVMNLTTITEWEDVVTKHFIDSLSILEIVDLSEFDGRIIDVGTGAGFPGLVLKIVFPRVTLTLLDSLNKRVVFLQEVIEALGLEGVTAIHSRAEDAGRDSTHREHYDLAVSRAVANIATLSEYCLPFVRVGGDFISYKTKDIEDELAASGKAVSMLGGEVADICHFTLWDSEEQRALLKIHKKSKISKVYPRRAGLASKEPLH